MRRSSSNCARLTNGKFDRVLGGKKERAAFEAFYSARNFAPLWITDGKMNARALAAIAYLGQGRCRRSRSGRLSGAERHLAQRPAALADAEMRLTASVVDLRASRAVGRVHWSRVSGDILYDLKPPTPAESSTAAWRMPRTSAKLSRLTSRMRRHTSRFGPNSRNCAPARRRPARLRSRTARRQRSARADPRVPQLRERLGIAGDGIRSTRRWPMRVKKFQQEHELQGDRQAHAANDRSAQRHGSPIGRSIPSSPTWNAGGGCRMISAGPT